MAEVIYWVIPEVLDESGRVRLDIHEDHKVVTLKLPESLSVYLVAGDEVTRIVGPYGVQVLPVEVNGVGRDQTIGRPEVADTVRQLRGHLSHTPLGDRDSGVAKATGDHSRASDRRGDDRLTRGATAADNTSIESDKPTGAVDAVDVTKE